MWKNPRQVVIAAALVRLAAIAAIAAVMVADVKDGSVVDAAVCGVDSSRIPDPRIDVGEVEVCSLVLEFSYGRNRCMRW